MQSIGRPAHDVMQTYSLASVPLYDNKMKNGMYRTTFCTSHDDTLLMPTARRRGNLETTEVSIPVGVHVWRVDIIAKY